eukprot:11659812-Prorocentrum_lima.AAC.1
MTSSLVGSEMCIRDSTISGPVRFCVSPANSGPGRFCVSLANLPANQFQAVSYTHLTLPTICSV